MDDLHRELSFEEFLFYSEAPLKTSLGPSIQAQIHLHNIADNILSMCVFGPGLEPRLT